MFPQFTSDAQKIAGKITNLGQKTQELIQKGSQKIKHAIGQTPPTDQEVRTFLKHKNIPGWMEIYQLLKKYDVKPHVKYSASDLGNLPLANRQHWEQVLIQAGVHDRSERFNIINELVIADISPWMPIWASKSTAR